MRNDEEAPAIRKTEQQEALLVDRVIRVRNRPDKKSSNTVVASRKPMPCFRSFDSAF
jgi:hypothetical protein